MKNRKIFIKTIFISIVVFLFLIIGLLVTEICFRFSGGYPLAIIQLSDNDLWRIKKNLNNKKTTEEGNIYYLTTNCNGFRGPVPNINKSGGVKRILVLGDSYTANLGYPDDEIFTTIFANLLNGDTSLHQKFEVINTGVSAWSIDQEWQYFVNEGINLHPDYVIVVASPNDIREAYCKKFVTRDSNNSLEIHPPHFILKKRIGWYLASRSSFFQYLQEKNFHSNYGTMYDLFEMYPVNFGKEDKSDWDRPLYLKNPFPEILNAQSLYERLLVALQSQCRESDISMGVCLNAVLAESDSSYLKDTAVDINKVNNFFTELTSKSHLPFLNLNTAALNLRSPREIYMKNDFHYSLKGNFFVGEQLYTFFKNEFLLPEDRH